MNVVKKIAAVAAGAALGSLLLGTTPASAAGGNCVTGEACLYYNSNLAGARYGWAGSGNYTFTFQAWSGGSSGAGVPVKNNAASVANLDTYWNLTVYYNSNLNCSYACQSIPASSWANFIPALKNQNASQDWY